jgi:tetratricopeptide (TPR) repeat protein
MKRPDFYFRFFGSPHVDNCKEADINPKLWFILYLFVRTGRLQITRFQTFFKKSARAAKPATVASNHSRMLNLAVASGNSEIRLKAIVKEEGEGTAAAYVLARDRYSADFLDFERHYYNAMDAQQPKETRLAEAHAALELADRGDFMLGVHLYATTPLPHAGKLTSIPELLEVIRKDYSKKRDELRRLFEKLAISEESQSTFQFGAIRTEPPTFAGEYIDSVPVRDSARDIPWQEDAVHVQTGRLEEVCALLEAHRHVIIVGGPGYGKTRLAIEVATALHPRFEQPYRFLSMSYISPSAPLAFLRDEIANIIGSGTGDRDERLLVLDGCEHLASQFARLLPELKAKFPSHYVLVTSHVPITINSVPVAFQYRLDTLEVPEDLENEAEMISAEELLTYSSVRLLCDRATRTRQDFELNSENAAEVVRTCRLWEGIPLALEMAAPYLGSTLAVAMENLDAIETTDPAFRHVTLGNCIAWACSLLNASREGRLLTRLGIFPAQWTLNACYAVCALEDMSAAQILRGVKGLCDRFLVQHDKWTRTYHLPEPVRLWARALLEDSGELESVAARYRSWVTESMANPIYRIGEADLDDIVANLDLHEIEEASEDESIRPALVAGSQSPGNDESGTQSTADERQQEYLRSRRALFWVMTGYCVQGERVFDRAAEVIPAPDPRLADIYLGSAAVAFMQCKFPKAQEAIEKCLEIARETENRALEAGAHSALGVVLAFQGDKAAGAEHIEKGLALATAMEDRRMIAFATLLSATYQWELGRLVDSERLFQKADLWYEGTGDKLMQAFARESLAHHCRRDNRVSEAASLYVNTLDTCRRLMFRRGLAGCVLGAAGVACAVGSYERAAYLYGAACASYRQQTANIIPPARRDYEADFLLVEKELGSARYQHIRREGESLALHDAAQEARRTLIDIRRQLALGTPCFIAHPYSSTHNSVK